MLSEYQRLTVDCIKRVGLKVNWQTSNVLIKTMNGKITGYNEEYTILMSKSEQPELNNASEKQDGFERCGSCGGKN